MKDDPLKTRERAAEPDNQSRRLHFFSSFEEENDATAEIMANRSPLENFQIAHEMIKAMYKDELAAMTDEPFKRITFTVIDGRPV